MAWSKNGKIVQYMNGYVHLVPKGDVRDTCVIDKYATEKPLPGTSGLKMFLLNVSQR